VPVRQDEMSEEQRNAGFTGRGSTADPGTPEVQGLYDPALDKDSCGVGFIADIKGRKSHQIIEDGLRILCNLEHRGAVGAAPRKGVGGG
jgi:glutamate synthase (NADPH/NADH) large chain